MNIPAITKVDSINIFQRSGKEGKCIAIFFRDQNDNSFLGWVEDKDIDTKLSADKAVDFSFSANSCSTTSIDLVNSFPVKYFEDIMTIIKLVPHSKQVKKSDIEKLFGCDIVNG